MRKFAKVSKYVDDPSVKLPVRSTEKSAGYDFFAAEDTIIPSYWKKLAQLFEREKAVDAPLTLEESAAYNKDHALKAVTVPTGVKVYLEADEELELRSRSSVGTKNLLMLPNGVGTIDADYVDNPDNEGLIMIAFINFSPCDISIKKGDKIGQGIIHKYLKVDEDDVTSKREGGFGSTGV